MCFYLYNFLKDYKDKKDQWLQMVDGCWLKKRAREIFEVVEMPYTLVGLIVLPLKRVAVNKLFFKLDF